MSSPLNLCNFPLLRIRDVPCGCAMPPLQCEVDEVADLPACDGGGTAYFPSPPYPANTPIMNGDVFVVTDEFDNPTPFFFWDCVWYPFLSDIIDGDSDWFKEGTAGPFYGGINTDPAFHEGTIGVRRITIRGNMAVDVGDGTGDADGGILAEGFFTETPLPLPISGAGTRMMWIPSRGAFRAGGLDGAGIFAGAEWDAVNMGDFSVSFGINGVASGVGSFNIGNDCESSGRWSFTAGERTKATLDSAFAIGEDTQAIEDDSFAGGAFTVSNARRGWVTGRDCIAQPRGGEPFVLRTWIHGWNSENNGETSMVFGEYLHLEGDHSVLFGRQPVGVQALYTQDESFITHRIRAFMYAPNTAPVDAEIHASQVSFWIDEVSDDLVFRVRYSGGTYKTGRVALV